ncbi:hypothetical protein BGZ76_002746 [Entomortierella beljakovae]|nr:hypothetical protein BGZ76_002746 [Entomortierella beljakovae]
MAEVEEPFSLDAILDETDTNDYYIPMEMTPSHFKPAEEVIRELKVIANYPFIGPEKLDLRQRYGLEMTICKKIVGYQYQSYLLDPYLDELVSILINPIRKAVHDLTVGEHKGKELNGHGTQAFYMLYFISKTRGYKTVVKFLPHEVADIEPTFEFLKAQNLRRGAWETRYILLIWLSLMCMIPFDLKSIDSQATMSSERIPLVDQMIETSKGYMDRAGKDRDAASVFLARLLTRKDTSILYLPEFIDWSKSVLSSNPNLFQAIGILGTLCWMFKIGQREVLLPIAEGLDELLASIESKEQFMSNSATKKLHVKLSQRVGLCLLKPRVASWRYQRGSRSLASNLAMESITSGASTVEKVSNSIAEETEDDENFEVPDEIENVIERLMSGLRDRDTIVRWSAAKGIGRISNRLPKEMADDVVGSIFELFSEDVFQLPNGEPDISSVSEHTWHGACLAVAELSRRGLLLPHRLSELIPWIILALKFDIKRGAHSIGSNVRDSACYVCWSFARAYTPEVLDDHVRKLSNTLIAVSVFDRDINIRRASSAAFQENVGRMGIFPHGIDITTVADYFAVGNINNSFLNVAPFIAKFDEYRRYLSQHLLDFVIPHWDIEVREVAAESMAKIAVLDFEYACSEIIPTLTKMTSSLDPAIRHGSLVALGKTCRAIKESSKVPIDQLISAETMKGIAGVVPSVPEYLLAGFGSEHIRQALCVFITSLSKAGWPVENVSTSSSSSVLDSWKEMIETTLERIEEPLQKLAAETFRDLVAQYGITESEFEKYLARTSKGAERFGLRGFALALGEIDYRDVRYSPWVSKTINGFSQTVKATNDIDPEAKRNAADAVTNIVKVLGKQYRQVVTPELSRSILEIYYSGLLDYNIDHRGDVGSWIRESSMRGLETMVPLIARLDHEVATDPSQPQYLSGKDHTEVLAKLLQQSVEKIDRIRTSAAAVIVTLLYSRLSIDPFILTEEDDPEDVTDYLLKIPHRKMFMKAYTKMDVIDLKWLHPAMVYTRVVDLLNIPEYRTSLLLGFVVSAGGLAESLVRHSSTCLSEFVSDLPITDKDVDESSDKPVLTLVAFGGEIMKIVEEYEGQDRVIVPLLEVLDMLFESGSMLMMEGEYDFAPMVLFVRRQTVRCKDTRKLIACIKTYCGLCGLGGKIKKAILLELLRLLVHPFPKIRRATADSMYLMLNSSADEPTPESEKVGELLMNSDWNQTIAQLTPIRDQLYPLLDLEKPKPIPASKGK